MKIKRLNCIKKVKQKLAKTFNIIDIKSICFYLSLKNKKNCQKITRSFLTYIY